MPLPVAILLASFCKAVCRSSRGLLLKQGQQSFARQSVRAQTRPVRQRSQKQACRQLSWYRWSLRDRSPCTPSGTATPCTCSTPARRCRACWGTRARSRRRFTRGCLRWTWPPGTGCSFRWRGMKLWQFFATLLNKVYIPHLKIPERYIKCTFFVSVRYFLLSWYQCTDIILVRYLKCTFNG